ncbi:MAG: cytochrome c biogenesis protein CcsA [Candidatus Hodarchaeales archaeon]
MIDIGFGIIELELGTLLLLVSFVALLLDAALLLSGKYIEKWELLSESSLVTGSTTLILSFGYFSYSVLSGDYTLMYVRRHVSNDMDFFMRLSAIWSGQAGSYFFWAFLILISYIIFRQLFRDSAHESVIWRSFLLSSIQITILLALTLLSDPFAINPDLVTNGVGLNPLLMNIWNIIHPPVIFIGYALCMLPTVVAIAKISVLKDGKTPDFAVKKKLDNFIEFLISLAWFVLSSGIIIGAYWAYITLGWGGFWAWDPIETASLVPWFFLTLYYHGKHFHRKSEYLANYIISMTYTGALFATYLTRSAVVTSVHAFKPEGVLESILGLFLPADSAIMNIILRFLPEERMLLLFIAISAFFLIPHVYGITKKQLGQLPISLKREDFQVSKARVTSLKISYIAGLMGTYVIIMGLIAPVIYDILGYLLPFNELGLVSSITVGESYYNTVATFFGGILLVTSFFCIFYPALDIKKKFGLAIGGLVAGIVFVAGGNGFFDPILGANNAILGVFKLFWTDSDKANLIIPLIFLGLLGLIADFVRILAKENKDFIRKSSQTMLHISFLVIILGAVTSANMITTFQIPMQEDGVYDVPGGITIEVKDLKRTIPQSGRHSAIYDTQLLITSGSQVVGYTISRLAFDRVFGPDHKVTIAQTLFADIYIVTEDFWEDPISGEFSVVLLQVKIIPYINILWAGCLFLHFAIIPLTLGRLMVFRETLRTRKEDVDIHIDETETQNDKSDKEEITAIIGEES